MGKKCGVKDPEVDPAIERAIGFFGYFVDKGAIPYGEHEPWPYHENNGKNSHVRRDVRAPGDRAREARSSSRRWPRPATGAGNAGTPGQGFSYLWGALGANAGGPAAAAAFFKEASWHLDLVRRCDGSFTYDGGEQYGPGRTDDNTYYGKSSYYGLSPTATYVLTYSLPLKKLCITGRDANQANWLSKKEVADAIASGRFDVDRKQMSPQELVAAFGDWSPVVRGWAAEELAKRPEAKAMVPQLIAMAEGKDAHVSQGACEALGYLKSAGGAARPGPPALPRRTAGCASRRRRPSGRWAARRSRPSPTSSRRSPGPPNRSSRSTGPIRSSSPMANWPPHCSQGPLTDALKDADPKLLYPAIRVGRQQRGRHGPGHA